MRRLIGGWWFFNRTGSEAPPQTAEIRRLRVTAHMLLCRRSSHPPHRPPGRRGAVAFAPGMIGASPFCAGGFGLDAPGRIGFAGSGSLGCGRSAGFGSGATPDRAESCEGSTAGGTVVVDGGIAGRMSRAGGLPEGGNVITRGGRSVMKSGGGATGRVSPTLSGSIAGSGVAVSASRVDATAASLILDGGTP